MFAMLADLCLNVVHLIYFLDSKPAPIKINEMHSCISSVNILTYFLY